MKASAFKEKKPPTRETNKDESATKNVLDLNAYIKNSHFMCITVTENITRQICFASKEFVPQKYYFRHF